MHYYLLSKGRVGRQHTLKYLPDELKKNHLTFVTPKPEVKEHKAQEYGQDLKYLGVDPDMMLGDKFLLIAKHHQASGGNEFAILDDDLKLKIFDPTTEKFSSTRTANQKAVMDHLMKKIPKLLKTHPCVGLGSLSRNSTLEWLKANEFHRLNRKVCAFICYRADFIVPLADRPYMQQLWCQDTNWNLEVLLAGGTTYSDFRMAWESDINPSTNPGGANLYRNTDACNTTFLRIMLHYPGLISRGESKVHHHSFLNINWRRLDKGTYTIEAAAREGSMLFQQELAFQKKTIDKFLKEVPPKARSWYEKRILLLGADKKPRSLFE